MSIRITTRSHQIIREKLDGFRPHPRAEAGETRQKMIELQEVENTHAKYHCYLSKPGIR